MQGERSEGRRMEVGILVEYLPDELSLVLLIAEFLTQGTKSLRSKVSKCALL